MYKNIKNIPIGIFFRVLLIFRWSLRFIKKESNTLSIQELPENKLSVALTNQSI